MGFEPTRVEHNGLAVHRLNHTATSSHIGCVIEPDGNTATHREREGKELDTGDVVPKMAKNGGKGTAKGGGKKRKKGGKGERGKREKERRKKMQIHLLQLTMKSF